MTIKPSLAAFAAVSSAVLFYGQVAHAQAFSPEITSPSQAEILPQMHVPKDYVAPKPPEPPQPPTPVVAAPQDPPPAPAPVSVPQPTVSQVRASSSGNTYVQGQCTWYVKEKRPDLPNYLGNGGQWVANAATQGFATGTAPRAGAVAEQPGHVAYVESVNGDGTINISEMNYNGGVGIVHYRTVAASSFTYIY